MHFSLSITILPEKRLSFSKLIAPVGQTLLAPQKGDLSQFFSFKFAFFTLSLLTSTPYRYIIYFFYLHVNKEDLSVVK